MNAKDLGELAEVRFTIKASEKGYRISNPVFHNSKYDAVLDNGRKLYRVQIKSCYSVSYKSGKPFYEINTSYGKSSKNFYNKSIVDVIAIYIGKLNLWYVVPFKELENKVKISLRPDGNSKYNKYLENWEFFK